MTTLHLTIPIVMTRRQGDHYQRLELSEFNFEKRGAGDAENEPEMMRSCLSSFHDQAGHPVTEDILRELKLEDGIKRGARKIFGDIPE